MELYVKVSFWLMALSVFVRLIQLSVADYPRKQEYKIGFDIAVLIEKCIFMAWAGALLFIIT